MEGLADNAGNKASDSYPGIYDVQCHRRELEGKDDKTTLGRLFYADVIRVRYY